MRYRCVRGEHFSVLNHVYHVMVHGSLWKLENKTTACHGKSRGPTVIAVIFTLVSCIVMKSAGIENSEDKKIA